MKSTKLKMAALSVAAGLGLLAFTVIKNGSISGTITPASSAADALAISGMDTVRANIDNGSFKLNNVKPGTYKVVVEAVAPYKNFEKEGVTVTDGKTTDLGEITLQQ